MVPLARTGLTAPAVEGRGLNEGLGRTDHLAHGVFGVPLRKARHLVCDCVAVLPVELWRLEGKGVEDKDLTPVGSSQLLKGLKKLATQAMAPMRRLYPQVQQFTVVAPSSTTCATNEVTLIRRCARKDLCCALHRAFSEVELHDTAFNRGGDLWGDFFVGGDAWLQMCGLTFELSCPRRQAL